MPSVHGDDDDAISDCSDSTGSSFEDEVEEGASEIDAEYDVISGSVLCIIENTNCWKFELDCAQRAQTFAKASDRNRIKWPGIQNRILMPMSARSLPIYCEFIILSASSHFADCHENRSVTVREMLINLLKSISQWWRKGKSDLESTLLDHHKNLISFSDW